MADFMRPFTGVGKQKLQETAPGVFAEEAFAHNSWSAAIGNGHAYLIGSGRISLSVAGNVRALISNPAGNTRGVVLLAVSSFGSGTSWATLYENPTVGLPAAAVRPRWRLNPTAGDAGTVEVSVDVDTTVALSGGTDTGIVLGLPGNSRSEIGPVGKLILPGQSIGVAVPFAGAADVAFNLYITEE